MADSIVLKVWGDLACFTRPELKVERLSYPLMTPSAARGVLEAILWKPQMRWVVEHITVLAPWPNYQGPPYFRTMPIRRNEIQGKIAPRTVQGWMHAPQTFSPYLVDSAGRDGADGENRTQRNTIALRDVAYLIHARLELTPQANRPRTRPPDIDESDGPDTLAKYSAIFQRRVAKGQCFHRPYLGCREFAAQFAFPDGSEQVQTGWNEPLGLMLYDLQFSSSGTHRPGFFQAEIKEGVLHCDPQRPGPLGQPPIQIFGWDIPGGP